MCSKRPVQSWCAHAVLTFLMLTGGLRIYWQLLSGKLTPAGFARFQHHARRIVHVDVLNHSDDELFRMIKALHPTTRTEGDDSDEAADEKFVESEKDLIKAVKEVQQYVKTASEDWEKFDKLVPAPES